MPCPAFGINYWLFGVDKAHGFLNVPMNILFLYISLGDLSNPGVFADLIKEFAKHGHNVTVAAPAKVGMKVGLGEEAGIKTLRFKTDQLTGNKSNIKKGLAYIKLIWQYPQSIKRYLGKEHFDFIIGHSLPPELGLIIPRLKRMFNAKFYLQLCEFIWQDSVALGFYKESSLICRYYKWLEARLIKSADHIGCPSQRNIDFALSFHPWAEKKEIHVVNYCLYPVDASSFTNTFRTKYHLEDKFVAIYGGSVNIAQKIENVVSLAESCLEYTGIVFCIIGRGAKIDTIKMDAQERGITNILFLDYMPQLEYMSLLNSCDVGLVSLNEKLQMPNIPSKTLTLFNLHKPIVASIDHSTDYGRLLESIGAGKWCYAGETETFKRNLLSLYEDRDLCKRLGENGYAYYLNNMVPEKSYQIIMNHIETV